MDTCRSGEITPWQRRSGCKPPEVIEGRRGSGTHKTNLTPDFLFLLACDPGGWASDSDSLSSALVKSLQPKGISIRAACEQAIEMIKQTSRGRQRPWLNQRAGPTFSNIRRLQALDEDDREVECVPEWVQLAVARLLGFTTALLVLICFFGLFLCFKIAGAEEVARGKTCPDNSCFCTDCHHRDIYSNDDHDVARFNCSLWDEGPILNRCNIAKVLHVTKIFVALIMSRKSSLRLLGFAPRDGATPLDLCVILISGVNVITSVRLPLPDAIHVTLIGYSYGILNFAFVAASISIVILIYAEFPGASPLWNRGQIVPALTASFLVTALIGQGSIFAWSRTIGLISAEHAGRQQMLFYASRVFTGALLAMIGFVKSRGRREAVATKSSSVLFVSLCWLFVVLAWLLTSHYDRQLMAKYHLLRVVAERACNFWKIDLMVWFSEHSLQCTRGRADGSLWRMRAPRVIPAGHFQSEQMQTMGHTQLLQDQDQFHML